MLYRNTERFSLLQTFAEDFLVIGHEPDFYLIYTDNSTYILPTEYYILAHYMEVIHPNPRNSRNSFFHSIFAFSSFARHGRMNLTLLGCSILQHMFRAYRWLLVFEHIEVEVPSSSLAPTLVMVPLHTGPTVGSVCHFRQNCHPGPSQPLQLYWVIRSDQAVSLQLVVCVGWVSPMLFAAYHVEVSCCRLFLQPTMIRLKSLPC